MKQKYTKKVLYLAKLSSLRGIVAVCPHVLLAGGIDLDRQTPMFLPYGLREL
jgi:hypothetical protein